MLNRWLVGVMVVVGSVMTSMGIRVVGRMACTK